MRRGWIALALLLPAFAQRPEQVKWALELEPPAAAPGGRVLARLTGNIERGWHLYSMTTAAAIPTTIQLAANPAVERVRFYQPKPTRAYDPNFQLETETYENTAVFLLELELKGEVASGALPVSAEVRYQTCNDKMCIPPVRRTASAELKVDPGYRARAVQIPAGYVQVDQAAKRGGAVPAPAPQGLAGFLLVAFGFGLAAIFTPCVFPMIPITMSFFLNRPSGTRQETVFHAAIFCLGIVVLFTSLGLAVTALLGPFGIVQLGSNPWVNGFIALVFLVFGLSLLGAFEITIPSTLLTRLDSASRGGGVAGTLLMGLTFSLSSFACVGPFVGTLLAASVQGGTAGPLLGMAVFAAGLSLPFFLLALFPAYLKKLPRSGGWMARVKVVMGFIILAAMVHYLSNIDRVLQTGLITRERFLAAWVVLLSLAGLYLLGLLRMEGVKPEQNVGVSRLLIGAAMLVFALSLLPGMFGGALGDLEAYLPPPAGGAAASGGEKGLAWMKNQYREALERARAENKLVFVNFTGYACTNCHWMKANMFTRPEIAAALGNFILVELYTDGTDEASRLNQELQLARFNTVAIPFYAILDAKENVVATFPGLTKDPPAYLAFLNQKPAEVPATDGTGTLAEVALASLNGGRFDTAPLEGKVLVLNFWATWCVPCIQEIPSFNRLHEQYRDKGVAVLGVSMDEEGAPVVQQFLRKHPMKYAVALGSEAAAGRFAVIQYPTTLLFDRAGKQTMRFEGFTPEAALEAAVKAAL